MSMVGIDARIRRMALVIAGLLAGMASAALVSAQQPSIEITRTA